MASSTTVDRRKGGRAYALVFLLPALLVLGAMVVYPALKTIYDSFFDRFGDQFVGLENYQQMFRLDRMRRAILNSFLWTVIFPVLVTGVGLVLAVLSEKIKWRTAFKLIMFLPIAIAPHVLRNHLADRLRRLAGQRRAQCSNRRSRFALLACRGLRRSNSLDGHSRRRGRSHHVSG